MSFTTTATGLPQNDHRGHPSGCLPCVLQNSSTEYIIVTVPKPTHHSHEEQDGCDNARVRNPAIPSQTYTDIPESVMTITGESPFNGWLGRIIWVATWCMACGRYTDKRAGINGGGFGSFL